MPTPPKNNSDKTNAISSNSSANAQNASPAQSSSAGYPPPSLGRFGNLQPLVRMPNQGEVYAPTPDDQPPNGGLVPGVYYNNSRYFVMPEPPLAQPAGGTRAEQPPSASSASGSKGQNDPSDAVGKSQGGSK